jgi:diacylglycerol kinase (ATP)
MFSLVSSVVQEWDWPFVALLATWLVIIPYLVLFPPQMLYIRKKLRAQQEKRMLQACSFKDAWQMKKKATEASPAVAKKLDDLADSAAVGSPIKAGSKASTTALLSGSLSSSCHPLQSDAAAAAAASANLPRWVIPSNAPVIVALVNKKSGGQLGATTMRNLQALLHPAQIFDLGELPDIAVILRSITGQFKLLICGGDGTVSWAMDVATQCGIRPPLAILPLGTGNDLSRSLGWGAGFGLGDVSEDAVRTVLVNMHKNSAVQHIDRWQVAFAPTNGGPIVRKRMINYFSTGIDAEISLQFHRERQDFPERFSSQTKNVLKYAMMGFEAAFDARPLAGSVRVEADGTEVSLMDGWKGMIVSNVPFYHGGKNFWGDDPEDDFGPALIDDGQLEIMGLAGTFHIGLCNIKMDSALRLGQGQHIQVELKDDCAVQIDGEPFPQPPSTVTFTKSDQYPMLKVCS